MGARTVSVDDIDHTWGKSRVVYQAGKLECCERGEFGGLVGYRVRLLKGNVRRQTDL